MINGVNLRKRWLEDYEIVSIKEIAGQMKTLHESDKLPGNALGIILQLIDIGLYDACFRWIESWDTN